jgi:hypothetical protein
MCQKAGVNKKDKVVVDGPIAEKKDSEGKT